MEKNQSLLTPIASIDPATVTIPDGQKLQKGWISVGVMDDNLKRLFSAYDASLEHLKTIKRQITEESAAHREKHLASKICACDCEKHNAEMEELGNQLKVADLECEQLKNLFWASVRLHFPELLGKASITLTESFEVAYDEEAQQKVAASMKEAGDDLRKLSELLVFEFLGVGGSLGSRR